MSQSMFSPYGLVGGTSLALQIGHRLSVDIDMFGEAKPDEDAFIGTLSSFGHVQILQKTANILICNVDGIKVDFVCYPYQLLRPFEVMDGIRLASLEDIAAMKLNAIAGRGSKKDFIDFYFLLRKYSLEEMIAFYQVKYPQGSEFMVRKSLTFFDDADKESDPVMLENLSWSQIKKDLLNRI